MKKRNIFLTFIILLIIIGFGYYKLTSRSSKIGEISFYKDADMELKVVLIHENLPFHYVGNRYSVACQSKNTSTFPEWEWDKIEKGWNRIDVYLGNGLGNDTSLLLQSLADEARKKIHVKDKMTLVVLSNPNVYASFDGCRTFTSWNLKNNIPADLIVESTNEFETCVEQQKKDIEMGLTSYGDCIDQKFTDKNTPVFQNIIANQNGYAAFKVVSSAFKDNQVLNVETKDFGKTWKSSLITPRSQ